MKFAIQPTALISDIKFNPPAPVGYPATGSPYGANGTSDPRATVAADLNGDGHLDIFLHPSYFSYGPAMAPVVLLNDGKGTFTDGTAALFGTAPPVLQQTNSVFFQDFNRDGRLDLFVVDQGLEMHDKAPGTWDGAVNRLFLQGADGKFADASATLPHNAPNFNHVSSMADINGDGNADIVLTTLGGGFEGQGTAFYFGDGKGGFTFTTGDLPEEVRYMPDSERKWNSPTIDYQYSGSNGIGDLNGDGRADFVSASYLAGDNVSKQRTIRAFEQLADGSFAQKWSIAQPAALQQQLGDLGVAGIKVADLDGDGRADIVAMWETGGKTAVQILRNMGGMQFADTTTAWLGSYLPRELKEDGQGAYQGTMAGLSLVDADNDGDIDLVSQQFSVAPAQLAEGRPTAAFLYLNDGAGRFSPAIPAIAGQNVSAQALGTMTDNPPWGMGQPLVFDANSDGRADMVFLEVLHGLDETVFPYRPTTLHVSVLAGADTGGIYRADELGSLLNGSSGNDTFHAGRGSDRINGGAGVDTAIYSSPFASASLSMGASGARITAGAATDILTAVERVRFSDIDAGLVYGTRAGYQVQRGADGAVTVGQNGGASQPLGEVDRVYFTDAAVRFDVDGVAGQTYRLYQAAFGRVPDLGGLSWWIKLADGGMTMADISKSFTQSPEFLKMYAGATTSTAIVDLFYENVLHRDGEDAGMKWWTGLLDNKTLTVPEVLLAFADGPENQAALIGSIQNGITYQA